LHQSSHFPIVSSKRGTVIAVKNKCARDSARSDRSFVASLDANKEQLIELLSAPDFKQSGRTEQAIGWLLALNFQPYRTPAGVFWSEPRGPIGELKIILIRRVSTEIEEAYASQTAAKRIFVSIGRAHTYAFIREDACKSVVVGRVP
jgi:hypothetical protein